MEHPKPADFYGIVRDMIRDQMKPQDERRMLRRILWERAKGELVSMTYTYPIESENRTRTMCAVEDFITAIENYLMIEQGANDGQRRKLENGNG